MSHRNACLALLVVVGLVLFSAGCKKKPPAVMPDVPDQAAVEPEPTPMTKPPVEVRGTEFDEAPVETEEAPRLGHDEINRMLQTVYFDFDEYDLTSESRRTLQANYNVLSKNAGFDIVIQGHCDERGTIEYNLALGEKRAAAVRDYLVSLGLARSRLRIVSYGEERPAEAGHTESAWAKNRRAAFDVAR